jgi:hypothetical protein
MVIFAPYANFTTTFGVSPISTLMLRGFIPAMSMRF